MPIFETHTPHGALRQGDVLKNQYLPPILLNGTPDPKSKKDSFALVISRNCEADRAEFIVVAYISTAPETLFKQLNPEKSEEKSEDVDENIVDTLRRRLFALRDGEGTPNIMYLGELPTDPPSPRRYAVAINRLHLIQLPSERTARQTWINNHRIARLSHDYRRDLHLRIFNTFAREGFEDLSSLSTADLAWLIQTSNAQIFKGESRLQTLQGQLNVAQGAGTESTKANKNLSSNISNIEEKLKKMRSDLQPFKEEQTRRNSPVQDP